MAKLLPPLHVVPKIAVMLASGIVAKSGAKPFRLESVPGHESMRNDVIYHAPVSFPAGIVVFFGGDTQDYTENMMSHRDSKAHVRWNLESTSSLLHERFPQSEIFVIKPSHMHLKTFSCYHNFVEGNNFGAPTYKMCTKSLRHLKALVQNAFARSRSFHGESVAASQCEDGPSIPTCDKIAYDDLPISLIGFSKGCVVLNQLLYAFAAVSEKPEEELLDFVNRITVMFWLDGGHSGTSSCWVTDKYVLQNFATMSIKARVHVTPYQVLCETRPRIGKEEKIFRETLRRLGVDIERTLHFEDCPRSLEYHFKVIEEFVSSEGQ